MAVFGTLQRTTSILNKDMAINLSCLQRNIDTRTMNNVVAASTALARSVLECRQTDVGGAGADLQSSNDDNVELSASQPRPQLTNTHSSDTVDVQDLPRVVHTVHRGTLGAGHPAWRRPGRTKLRFAQLGQQRQAITQELKIVVPA